MPEYKMPSALARPSHAHPQNQHTPIMPQISSWGFAADHPGTADPSLPQASAWVIPGAQGSMSSSPGDRASGLGNRTTVPGDRTRSIGCCRGPSSCPLLISQATR